MAGQPGDGGQPTWVQNVVATSGYAYGVIGADLHVLRGEGPLYLLENYRGPPQADPKWLRELPSRMLSARFAVVPYTGREHELADLREWRQTGSRLAARWLHAPGGQGKTRLAARLAQESLAANWKVVTVTHGLGTVLPPPGSQDMRLGHAVGLLLVIDYADRWPLTHLTWLFSNALLKQPTPTRVLLLARTAYPWPAVRSKLADYQAGTSEHLLESLPDKPGERELMFMAARDSFAARYGATDPEGISPPGPLAHPDFGLSLTIHMAALVAIDAHVHGRRPPEDMAGLTTYLLDRERAHWELMYENGAKKGLDYKTPPSVMTEAVFTAAVTGAVSNAAGLATLGGLELELNPQRILTDHAKCYPPADPARDTVLEPLYPDRLAEDFLALTLPGHAVADDPAHAWATTVLSRLTARTSDHKAPPWTTRAITFLASAAKRWPHVGIDYLYPLLSRDPQLALDAGSAALVALASIERGEETVLNAIQLHLPKDRDSDLDVGIAALMQRLADYRLPRTHDPAQRAGIQTTLAMRLLYAGQRSQAVRAAEKATALYRDLASSSPASEPDLATSLSLLGAYLAEDGRRQEALTTVEQAVGILRPLAAGDPATYEPIMAASLSSLGGLLADEGRRPEALETTELAVEIWRRLAEGRPADHEPELARSLSNLGVRLADAGRQTEALDAEQEAVEIRRRLAKTKPAAYDRDLAWSLSNLGLRLAEVGRRPEALEAEHEAVEIRRRLAEGNPTAYEADLASSLSNLAGRLAEAGRRPEALEAEQEAVEIRRRLAGRNPAAHDRDLARSLSNLGVHLAGAGRRPEALEAEQQAVEIRWRLADYNLAAYQPDLARSLSNLSIRLAEAGRRSDALDAEQGALEIWQLLAQGKPAAYDRDLARSLSNLASHLAEAGHGPQALEAEQQAVEILRRLVEDKPAAYEPDFARLLSNLGAHLSEAGRRPEALAAEEKAVEIRRRLAKDNPAAYERDLARSLSNVGVYLGESGRHADALEAEGKAVEIRRRLAVANPVSCEPDLATSLSNLGVYLAEAGRRPEAVVASEHAVEIYRRLAAGDPATYEADLARSLSNLDLHRSNPKTGG